MLSMLSFRKLSCAASLAVLSLVLPASVASGGVSLSQFDAEVAPPPQLSDLIPTYSGILTALTPTRPKSSARSANLLAG